MRRRVNDDRLKQVADEVVAELELNHPVLSASELAYTPEWASEKRQKVVRIQFEDGFEDIHIVLGPGYGQESIKDQLRKAIGTRLKPMLRIQELTTRRLTERRTQHTKRTHRAG